ncbi:MAG TPA: 16S rRNA (cytidine(1402)-2'-O)-methyltransferase [Polyangiaceae bacterium]|nr:16S rRNA (cytidine(1402)-2'-O)-methyltransferase [Polyangiaceae bacterium]
MPEDPAWGRPLKSSLKASAKSRPASGEETGAEGVGTLFLVATPIGNLQDITLRAIETLKAVDTVAAEDTRRTRQLLSHLGITQKQLTSYNAHSGESVAARLLESLLAGANIALVTDAGTPSVSDPGTDLVGQAVRAGVPVVPIPGVSAVTAAVAVSGLVQNRFRFLGFAPQKGARRRELFEEVARSIDPCILFEAPHRAERTLGELARVCPDREAAVCRELTKVHEEVRRGTLRQLAEHEAEWRGEFTIVVAGAPVRDVEHGAPPEALDEEILGRLSAGETPRSIVEALEATADMPRRELYRRVTELCAASSAGEPSEG